MAWMRAVIPTFAAMLVGVCTSNSSGSIASESRVTIQQVVTDMSVVGPELHVLLHNNTQIDIPYVMALKHLQCEDGSTVVPIRAMDQRADSEHPWEIRREMALPVAGILSANGFAHRVYAFGRFRDKGFPCRARIEIITDAERYEFNARIERVGRAPVYWQQQPPLVSTNGWVDKDFIGEHLLAHVVVVSNQPKPVNVAVLDRKLICTTNTDATWDLIQDVPQGLASGPVRLDPNAWVAFLGVIDADASEASKDCTVEVRLGYEVTPTGFATLGVVRFPMKAQPGMYFTAENPN